MWLIFVQLHLFTSLIHILDVSYDFKLNIMFDTFALSFVLWTVRVLLCIFSVCSYKWKIHNGKIKAIFVLFIFIYIYFDFALVFAEFLVNRCIHYVYQNVKQKKAMVLKGESPDIETVYNSLGFSNYHSSMWVSI